MVRRLGILLIILALLIPAGGTAEMAWKQDTEGQKMLKRYTEQANRLLTEGGEMPVNSLFEMYSGFAVMGITAEPDAEMPESVEITVKLSPETLLTLQLRVSDVSRFPLIAASFLKALYGDGMTMEDALRIPKDRADRALGTPDNSFLEPVEEMNGTVPRVYYAYYPNQYHDGVNWIQMTLVFPMAGTWDGTGLIVGQEGRREGSGLAPEDEGDPDYEGYFSQDDYQHLEYFATPTPEPDSAAMEQLDRELRVQK